MSLALFTVLFKSTELIDRKKQPVEAFYFAMNSPGQEKNLNVSAAFSLTDTALKMQKHSQKRQLTDCLSVIHESSLFLVQRFGHELKNKDKETNRSGSQSIRT